MENAGEEEEQDGLSVHSPGQAPPSSASSLPKEHSQVELELRVLEALEIYPPSKLQGIHRHFVLYGLMEFLRRSFGRNFSPDEVLQLLDRFFNLEMLLILLWDPLGHFINGPILRHNTFSPCWHVGSKAASPFHLGSENWLPYN
ncbi:uncharacterized protein LOC131219322 isoform X2 [Magnolia sinica]|nr:uncharacterized protein LOC131219322 isoform X2 [Magnolia sinica]